MLILKEITLANNNLELEIVAKKNTIKTKDETILKVYETAWKNRLLIKAVEKEAVLAKKIFFATSILNIGIDINEKFAEFADVMYEIIGFDRIAIAILDRDKKEYSENVAKIVNGKGVFEEVTNQALINTSVGWVFNNKKPLIIYDLCFSKEFSEDEELYAMGMRSGIRFPLINEGEVIGVIKLSSKKPCFYLQKQLQALNLLTAHLTAIINNTRLYKGLQEKQKKVENNLISLSAINELSEVLVKQNSTDELLINSLKKILQLVNREMGAIFLLKEKKNVFELRFTQGMSQDLIKVMQNIKEGESPVWKAAHVGKTIIINNIPQYDDQFGVRIKEGIVAALYIPLIYKNKVIGVVPIGTKGQRAFDEEEIRLLEALANCLTPAIQRLKMLEKLSDMACYDPLSHLRNRQSFYKDLEAQVQRAERYDENFSLLMLDIDFFKKYNDSHGHLEGDRLIKKMGLLISKTLRDYDTAYRYGGEEFAVIARGVDCKETFALAERLCQTIQEKCKKEKTTISVGIASFPKQGNHAEELVKNADDALYIAKKDGRNCVREA